MHTYGPYFRDLRQEMYMCRWFSLVGHENSCRKSNIEVNVYHDLDLLIAGTKAGCAIVGSKSVQL